jgi:hypothetical protein
MRFKASVIFMCLSLLVFFSCKKIDSEPCNPYSLSEDLLGVYVSDSFYYGFDYASTPYIDSDTVYFQPSTITATKGCDSSILLNGQYFFREYPDTNTFCAKSFNPSAMHSSGSCVRYISVNRIRSGTGGSGPGYNSWSYRYYDKQ